MGIFDLLSRKKKKSDTEVRRPGVGVGASYGAVSGDSIAAIRRAAFSLSQMERALRHWNEPAVQRRAESVLTQMGNGRAVGGFIECLSDQDSEIRRGAAWALGMIGDAQAVDPLIRAMRDADWEVRLCVVEALGNIGDPRAADSLTLVMNHSNEIVRKTADETLEKLMARKEILKDQGIPALEGDSGTRKEPREEDEQLASSHSSADEATSEAQETPVARKKATKVKKPTPTSPPEDEVAAEAREVPVKRKKKTDKVKQSAPTSPSKRKVTAEAQGVPVTAGKRANKAKKSTPTSSSEGKPSTKGMSVAGKKRAKKVKRKD